jgi:hypothetical protein
MIFKDDMLFLGNQNGINCLARRTKEVYGLHVNRLLFFPKSIIMNQADTSPSTSGEMKVNLIYTNCVSIAGRACVEYVSELSVKKCRGCIQSHTEHRKIDACYAEKLQGNIKP